MRAKSWLGSAMKIQTGGQVEGGQVKIDGYVYVGVTFIRCRLVYAAVDTVAFQACNFVECSWGFIGAASLMASFLQHLFSSESGAAAIGQDILEHIKNQGMGPFELEPDLNPSR